MTTSTLYPVHVDTCSGALMLARKEGEPDILICASCKKTVRPTGPQWRQANDAHASAGLSEPIDLDKLGNREPKKRPTKKEREDAAKMSPELFNLDTFAPVDLSIRGRYARR